MTLQFSDFISALDGPCGEMDAWLEVNNEEEVREHINAWGRACRAAALEEAAKVCDKRAGWYEDKLEERMMRSVAAAIRALKDQKQP